LAPQSETAGEIPTAWSDGQLSSEATTALLATLRQGSDEAACAKVVELLRGGAAPQSIWDGLFCGAAELLLRQPGIVALHAVTTTNALHYAFQASEDDTTRRLLLLQNAAFLPLFREAMRGRGELREAAIDQLSAVPLASRGEKAVEDIFATLNADRQAGVGQTLAYLQTQGTVENLMAAGRHLILLKGDDAHDYKFSAAALEDYYHLSPAWRDRYLAACMIRLRGSDEKDNGLIQRVKAAL
jgi:hypothetical protein